MLAKVIPLTMAKYFPRISSSLLIIHKFFIYTPKQTQSKAAPNPPAIAPKTESRISTA
jgi:hypothetical protein